MRWYILFILCLLSEAGFTQANSELIGMQVKSNSLASHFIFLLNQKTSGHVTHFQSSKKLLLEFANTKKIVNINSLSLKNTNVAAISAKTNLNKLSLVFVLKHNIKYNIHFISQDKHGFARLQLDLISILPNKTNFEVKTLKKVFQQDIIKTISALQNETPKKMNNMQNIATTKYYDYPSTEHPSPRIYNIIIDPGHGGKDPGAHGKYGASEKNIVLAISKKLATKINRSTNMRAILTRTQDVYVPLRGRLALARKDKADLFIAIHADAFFNKLATGASVYALSAHGATTEAARWLAQRDNYSELGGVELDALKDKSPLLRSVLIDLAQTATIRDSLILGNKVLDALDDISSLHYKHVAQAPFVVLKSPDIPSILVEVGFITNAREEKRLVNSWYQHQVAQALYQGINQYVQKYAKYGA